ESAHWLWSIIQESHALNKPDLIGLSIDIFGHCQQQDNVKAVTRVIALNSCDVVTRPSAGGSMNRILRSVGSSGTGGSLMNQTTNTTSPTTPVPNPGSSNLPVPVSSQSTTPIQNEARQAGGQGPALSLRVPAQPDLTQDLARMQEAQRAIEAQRAE